MRQIRLIIAASLMISPFAANADLITIDFRTDPNTVGVNTGSNGEVSGNEWISFGLNLSTPGTFNVGCGSVAPCLGADANSLNDFDGMIFGNLDSVSTFLSIFNCCDGSGTLTDVFDGSNILIGTFADSFTYNGEVSRWVTTFSSDAYYTISYDRLAVPEPGTLALLGIGLAGLGLVRRRKKF